MALVEPYQVAAHVYNDAILKARIAEKDTEELVFPNADKTSLIAKILDIPLRSSTYYWIAFIAQLCHFVLDIVVVESWAKFTSHVPGDRVAVLWFTTTFTCSLILVVILAFLLFSHYRGSGNVHSFAGNHYNTIRICAFMGAFSCASLVLIPFFFIGQKEWKDGIRHTPISFMFGFLDLVASVAGFMASRIIYRSSVSARGTKSVTVQVKVDIPAWTLATTKETDIYRRQGNGVKPSV